MAEPEFGPPCPGCTPEAIANRIARAQAVGGDLPACRACLAHGALFHAQRRTSAVVRSEGSHAEG